jgi:hypothetical protein
MTDKLEGGCACKAVRYTLESAPMYVHCCHCTSCQTENGSAFAINALIEADRVTMLSGAPEAVMTPSESGKGQQVWRCPDCKVAVWSNYGGSADMLRFIRVGTLDDKAALSPDIHIYTRSKLAWVGLPDDVHAVEGYYDSKALWPAESLARLGAVYSKS